jgi:hypothetical protein
MIRRRWRWKLLEDERELAILLSLFAMNRTENEDYDIAVMMNPLR